MNILIMQPKLDKGIVQLENELRNHPSVDIVIFPEGYLNENVEQACKLAESTNTIFIGGYTRFSESPKDRAIIINRKGKIMLDRIKYSPTSFLIEEGLKVGHILCDELIKQGVISEEASDIDLIVHPIGVGMFSKGQFEEWISAATAIAIQYKTMIIGTSHADGSFGDTGVSIPIAYCIDKEGSIVFIAENDVRARVLNIKTKEYYFPIEIRELKPNEAYPMDLLLLADPSKQLVEDYMVRGQCYVAEQDNGIIAVYVLLPTGPDTIELVNIAVDEEHQGKGIGKQLVNHAIDKAKLLGYKTIEVGTGNSSMGQLALYQKCGFRIVGVDRDFFVRHYAEEIFENGIQCRDMVRLAQDI